MLPAPTTSASVNTAPQKRAAPLANHSARAATLLIMLPLLPLALLGLYKISLGHYTLPLTFSEEEPFFSVPLSPDSPFLVAVSAFVAPL